MTGGIRIRSHPLFEFIICSPLELAGCQPVAFWNLARHGTRNPGDDDILEMAEGGEGALSRFFLNFEIGLSLETSV